MTKKSMVFGLGVLVLCGTLFSCATMKKDECLMADWYQIGYEDGAKGYALSRVGKHRKACAKHGVAPDMAAYEHGHEKGLYEYCTPESGYRVGLNGRSAGNACTGSFREPFMQGYHTGRDIYLFQQEIRKDEREQDNRHREITRIEDEIKQKEAGMGEACENSASCREALEDIRRLDRELSELKQEIRSADVKINSRKRTLADMKANARF